ncbi:thymus-specific serine protease-like [Toxorhynchites rutilus septentrionalis]|uniref:thymus-specific serine protease-like n=1 Tax=Toxorhynchites rutilus septentrionalis TaxID=329112 RepID=UPI00247921BF|nr:thymus-specific serine protease-like [Toxorhynchites rutilus septentrionalis]
MRSAIIITLALVAVAAAANVHKAKRHGEINPLLVQQILTKRPIAPPASGKSNPSGRLVVENFFTTRVDHFNAQNTDEWTLQYYSAPDNYREGGPILIFLSGNLPIRTDMVDDSSLMYELGRELHGAVYAFESRFFGQSWVTNDVSTENLHLLNSDQILADLAEFVQYLKGAVLRNEHAHVLVAGSGYGGALATWFRVRYPHLADAAWSSSGFHHAVPNFQQFAEAWGQTLIDFGGQRCYNDIFVAFHVIENLLDMGLADVVSERFNLCTPIDVEDSLQVQYFLAGLMSTVELFTLVNGNVSDFAVVCDEITNSQASSTLDALAQWFTSKVSMGEECINLDIDLTIDALREVEWNATLNQYGIRQTLYQECTEFGWFPTTTDSDHQPFGNRISLDLYTETCRRVFGDWITHDSLEYSTQRANNRFGGKLPAIQQAHFTFGAEDPTRPISITHDLNPMALADAIPGAIHASDLRATSDSDSEELRATKEHMKLLVSKYLFPVSPRVSVEDA